MTKLKNPKEHKRSYQHFRFTDTPSNDKARRAKKETEFGQNNLMSSALSHDNNIKPYIQPDSFNENARTMKFFSDFTSKICCLPGRYTRELKEESKPLRKHIVSGYINENTSLINGYPERQMDYFCSSRRITHNILEESKQTTDDLGLGKRHVHPGVKSQFKSHFELE